MVVNDTSSFKMLFTSFNFMLTDIKAIIYLPFQVTLALFSNGLFYFFTGLAVLLYASTIGFRRFFKQRRNIYAAQLSKDSRNIACGKTVVVAFFHPYCNAGGGGERVLWCAIRSLQTRYDFVQCVVYTGDLKETPDSIIKRAKQRFNIDLKRKVNFVYLHKRAWVEAIKYPFATLLGQSFGSVLLGIEALFKCAPDIYLDTMGYAFTLPLFKYFGGCKVGSYVHYPTISTDMLEKVNQGNTDFNNAAYISKSLVLSKIKLFYYHMFAYIYGMCGQCSDSVMVNSTWTLNHINHIWKIPTKTSIVYPPCDTKSLLELTIDAEESYKKIPNQIISVAQFRPEKNHLLQLQVFHKFLKGFSGASKEQFKLLLVGSCRNDGDQERVDELQKEVKRLQLMKQVEFHLNVPYEVLLDLLQESTVGIHTMQDEHFGIGVVEFMAGGLVTLAHNSAGPKMDIVINWKDNKTGYLANSVGSYVKSLNEIFAMTSKHRYELCLNARDCVKKRFSEETFKNRFLAETEVLIR